MRVVHLTMASVRGGVARVVESLAAAQAREHEVTVISGPGARPEGWSGPVRWEVQRIRGNSDIPGVLRLLQRLRELAADVAMVHACAPGELALVAALSSRRRGTVVLEHLPEHHPLGSPLRNRLYALLNRRASAWAAVSAAGARALEAKWGLPPGTLVHVHLGVPRPAEGLSPEEAAVLADGPPDMVLGLGAPNRRKGFDTFVRVAETLSTSLGGIRWIWVGGERRRRRGPVEVLPWSRCVGGWLRAARTLMVPSRAEGLPLVVMEALASGTPVIASRVGGIPEAVEDGVSGLLVAPEDVDGWCRAVRSILEDEVLRRRLGSAGRSVWEERFTVEAMLERVERLMETARSRWCRLDR